MVTNTRYISWKELTELEPKLQVLRDKVRRLRLDQNTNGCCFEAVWYGEQRCPIHIKAAYRDLVGFSRLPGKHLDSPENAILYTPDAYDVVMQTLLHDLYEWPSCNGQGLCARRRNAVIGDEVTEDEEKKEEKEEVGDGWIHITSLVEEWKAWRGYPTKGVDG